MDKNKKGIIIMICNVVIMIANYVINLFTQETEKAVSFIGGLLGVC